MRSPLVIFVLCLCSLINAVPLGLKKNMAIVQEQEEPMLMMAEEEETRPEMMISRLNLPSNATSIRADITDGFSCDNKTYGYYADVENECQIFHVCLPVTYADGKENTFRWSFICPEETVFSQEYFTCMRSEDMSIDCEESFKYYELNRNFGVIEPEEAPADQPEEEMTIEEMSRQPPSQSQGQEETNKQSIEAAPVKKQTFKVQNSNRRKTPANRVAIEAQRKKVQPLRKLPTPAIPATTVKPIVEEAPILEQEVERTTLKYQRLTKRPIAVIPEQTQPEEPKVEKEVVRQELFAQKRKRPQIYFPTRFDAAVNTDTESRPLPSLKTDILLQKKPEPALNDQAEAQASEIKEVSIKPQVDLKPTLTEKMEPLAVQKKEPAFVYIPITEEQPIELKSEIASLPENTPSQAEVVEIPIQKLDEPLMAEGSAVSSKIPEMASPEKTKPMADVMEPIKASDDELPSEVIAMKKIVAQAGNIDELEKPAEAQKTAELEKSTDMEKVSEAEKPENAEKAAEIEKSVEAEKVLLEPVSEPELVLSNKPEQVLETAKSDLQQTEPMQSMENVIELMVPEKPSPSKDIPLDEPMKKLANLAPKFQLKADIPVVEELPVIKTEESMPEIEKPQDQMDFKINVPAPEMPESELGKSEDLREEPKRSDAEPEASEAQPSKQTVDANQPLESEALVPEPQILLKTEMPAEKLTKPLEIEVPVSVEDKPMEAESAAPEMLSMVETTAPKLDMPLKMEAVAPETMKTPEKTAEIEIPSMDAKIELPVEIVSKPLDNISEPVKELLSESQLPLKAESPEVQSEASSEVQAEEVAPQPQSSAEKNTIQAATDNEEAQSLILDFISSLVNSENSNFEEQSAIINEMSADSLPEASAAEPVIAEAEPAIIQTQDEQVNPLYIPMMPSNDQMYQIPVQVIETPESEPEPAVPAKLNAEPKLPPLNADDVVELVKESLDTPAEKENLVQEPSNDDAAANTQPESEEVKPIYHRYIELGSNLLKSEALTASDDEPVIVPTENKESLLEKVSSELPKASEKLPEPEQLASKADSVQTTQTEVVKTEEKPTIQSEDLKEGRSLNRFKMDPRKRRFLFRSDAS